MDIKQWLRDNLATVNCSALKDVSEAAYIAAQISYYSDAQIIGGGASAISAALDVAWSLAGCNGDPPPPPLKTGNCQLVDGEGAIFVQAINEDGRNYTTLKYTDSVVSIDDQFDVPAQGNTYAGSRCEFTDTSGNSGYGFEGNIDSGWTYRWFIEPIVGECLEDPLPPLPPGPIGPDIPGPEIDDCTWTISPLDAYVDSNGVFHFGFEVRPSSSDCGSPFFFWSSVDGPDIQLPGPRCDDECKEGPAGPQGPRGPAGPKGEDGADGENGVDGIDGKDGEGGCDCDTINARFDQVDSELAAIKKLVSGGDDWDFSDIFLLVSGIYDLFTRNVPATSYRINGVCEDVDEDNPGQPYTEVFLPEESYETRLLSSFGAMEELLQAHLGYKTPICAPKRPQLEGDWVTLRFESTEKSPNSNRVLRKLLRYRSKSGAELGSITDYWRGFTWTTGPVVVTHKDAWWGTPQVWAVSADEGKRVLRHVAGEAGIDPDQVGRWEVSGSRNARYGVSLPVKFADLDGGPWVTQREGPSGPAEINR